MVMPSGAHAVLFKARPGPVWAPSSGVLSAADEGPGTGTDGRGSGPGQVLSTPKNSNAGKVSGTLLEARKCGRQLPGGGWPGRHLNSINPNAAWAWSGTHQCTPRTAHSRELPCPATTIAATKAAYKKYLEAQPSSISALSNDSPSTDAL